jgi:predicted amidohydrolase YtcJ
MKAFKLNINMITARCLTGAFALMAVLTLGNVAIAWNKEAEMVLLNGYIYSADATGKNKKIVQSIAIKNKKIIFVGSDDNGKDYIGKNTTVINLKGKMVLPGFVDSHMHPMATSAVIADQVDVTRVFTTAEYLQAIADFAARHPEKTVIQGSGYSRAAIINETGDHAQPTARLLDHAISDRPAAIFEVNGHSMWVNSKALQFLGITDTTPHPVALRQV